MATRTTRATGTTVRQGAAVRQGADATKATRTYFSQISTIEDLCSAFGKAFRISDFPLDPPRPSVNLARTLFKQPGELEAVVEAYNGCFMLEDPPMIVTHPPCLTPLLTLVRHCHRTSSYQFANGAGKLFMVYLLNLCYEIGETWLSRPSTTTDSRSDWCRVVQRTSTSRRTGLPREPNIGGIPDVLQRSLEPTF